MKRITLIIILLASANAFCQTDILFTDFQTGIPVSYTIVDNDGNTPDAQVAEYTSAWIAVQDPENPTDTVASSTSFFSPTGTANRWLITPALTLGAYGNIVEWEGKSQDASYPDDYMVLVSTTDNQITSFTDTVGWFIEENFEWTTRQINLSDSGYVSQTIYLAFVNITEDGFKLYLDDIHAWKDDPVSVVELDNINSITVYPNPSHGIINLKSSSEIEETTVLSSNGRVLMKTSSTTFDISELPTGIYFLSIKCDSGIVSKKILKL